MVHNGEFIRCQACDKRFSGPEPYQEHIRSEKHKKKAGIASDAQAQQSDNQSTYYCDLCRVTISGPIPYAHHIEGSKHKSQLNKKEIVDDLMTPKPENNPALLYPDLANLTPSLPPGLSIGTAPMTNVEVTKCDLCGVSLSGPENVKEHLDSKGHNRKLVLAGWKQVLGQNNPPASAPAEEKGGDAATSKEIKPEATPETGSEKKKHKKPGGCFRIFRCKRFHKKSKSKSDKATV